MVRFYGSTFIFNIKREMKDKIYEMALEYAETICPAEDYVDPKERAIDISIALDDSIHLLNWLQKEKGITI